MSEASAAEKHDGPTPCKPEECRLEMEEKMNTVDNQILHLMTRLDYLRKDMQLGMAREQEAIDLNIHWLMVELDTGTCPIVLQTQPGPKYLSIS